MIDEKTSKIAIDIILYAGEARVHCTRALEAIENSDFELAEKEIKRAKDTLIKAHKIQTLVISEEAQGKNKEYSVLITHAQDTLMTVYSEINLTKRFIKIFDVYDTRIKKLENCMRRKMNA